MRRLAQLLVVGAVLCFGAKADDAAAAEPATHHEAIVSENAEPPKG